MKNKKQNFNGVYIDFFKYKAKIIYINFINPWAINIILRPLLIIKNSIHLSLKGLYNLILKLNYYFIIKNNKFLTIYTSII